MKFEIIEANEVNYSMIERLVRRNQEVRVDIKNEVLNIIQAVKNQKDKAIIELTKKYDDVSLRPDEIKVGKEEIKKAYNKVNKEFIKAINEAKDNIFKFHEIQKQKELKIQIKSGIQINQIFRPIESIGIYVPGGRAIYPSTILMGSIPALIAGVKRIIISSPPNKNKTVAPEILVAANEVGISEIYKIGGAQAIAAMAYGTKIIPHVQKIIGPGNEWVNTAKFLLSNIISIDLPAGPSEILIIADGNANPDFITIDLFSQIEHDPSNIGIIISPSERLIYQVFEKINVYLNDIPRKDIITSALKNNCLFIKAGDLNECCKLANMIAPEHLQIMTKTPKNLLKKIFNAGAIFLGENTPVALGDYCAGTNHILPTGGMAKSCSGLTVNDFLKSINVLECNRKGLINLSNCTMILARQEGLMSHEKSIKIRLKEKN